MNSKVQISGKSKLSQTWNILLRNKQNISCDLSTVSLKSSTKWHGVKNVILRILIFALISLKLLVHIALMFSVKGAHYVFVWIACVQARVDRKENRGLGILRFHYTLYTHCRSFINFSGWPLYGAMGKVHQQHVLIVSMTTYPGISLWFRVIHLLQKVLLCFLFFNFSPIWLWVVECCYKFFLISQWDPLSNP